jgi:hypothetical protein
MMTHWMLKLGQKILLLLALAVVGGLPCAMTVRFAPGYGVDERELDPRLSRTLIRSENQPPDERLTTPKEQTQIPD